jgi:hypothetical protein
MSAMSAMSARLAWLLARAFAAFRTSRRGAQPIGCAVGAAAMRSRLLFD